MSEKKVLVTVNGEQFDLCDSGKSLERFSLYHVLPLCMSDSKVFDHSDVWVNDELLRGQDDVWYGVENGDVISIQEKSLEEKQCA